MRRSRMDAFDEINDDSSKSLVSHTLTRRMSGRTLARERESIKNEEGVGLSRFPLHADSPVAPSRRIVPAYTGLGYAESAPYLLLGGAPDVLLLAEEPVNGDPDEGVLRDPLAPPRRLAPVDAAGHGRQRIHLVAPQARLLAFEREVLRDPRRRRHGLIAALLPCGGFHSGPSPTPWSTLGRLPPIKRSPYRDHRATRQLPSCSHPRRCGSCAVRVRL